MFNRLCTVFSGILCSILVFAGVTTAMPAPGKPSTEMILILTHHKSGEHDLDPKGLRDDKTMHFPTKEEEPEYEIYQVPYPRGVADYFQYRVFLQTRTGKYWIHLSGGVAGVNRFLGPGKVADLKP